MSGAGGGGAAAAARAAGAVLGIPTFLVVAVEDERRLLMLSNGVPSRSSATRCRLALDIVVPGC